MVGKKKHFKFTYYEVVSEENEKEVLYDLTIWLNKITTKPIERRKETVRDVQGRLEAVSLIGSDFYVLNFMRLDEASDAYKAKENEKAEHIDLEDDEYLGKNTVALYDTKNHIILIQNNRGSYTANAIQNYINATNDGTICYFRPMIDKFNIDRCKKGVIKKVIARCSASKQFDADGSKAFEHIIESCNELGGYTFYVEIGIGKGKDKQLNNRGVYEAVNTLLNNRACISSAKIALSDDQDAAVYELFDNIRIGKFDLTVPERGELDYMMVAQNMYFQYLNG